MSRYCLEPAAHTVLAADGNLAHGTVPQLVWYTSTHPDEIKS